MKSCSQLEDIDELVLGRLSASRAEALRAHVVACAECREELALASAERALFSRRAEVASAPPPAVTIALRERLANEVAPSRSRRVGAGMLRILRRGHFTAACAAALFFVAAFSRLGGDRGALTSSSPIMVDGEGQASGVLASMTRHESFACSMTSASSLADDDVGSSSSSSSSSGTMSLASLDGVLACGGSASVSRVDTSCEPSVTCSSLRQ